MMKCLNDGSIYKETYVIKSKEAAKAEIANRRNDDCGDWRKRRL